MLKYAFHPSQLFSAIAELKPLNHMANAHYSLPVCPTLYLFTLCMVYVTRLEQKCHELRIFICAFHHRVSAPGPVFATK